jgi:hypothetical protein
MRLRATHSATVYAEQTVDTTELNKDLTETTDPVLQAPVRFDDVSVQYIRDLQGEHVEQAPRVWFPPYGKDPTTDEQVVSAERIEPGMDVGLVSSDGWGTDSDDRYAIAEVNINRRRGSRPERVECELQYHE